ncbi:MAG: M15 family metallopeptidase, partial [Clostridia bacterium]|nr:M15 family metallopeptidase [Clostridia bacterium]
GEGNWQISAAYRTVAQQQTLFDRQVNSYIKNNGLSRSKAISATRKTVADPGTSEHHLGLAFDITIPGKTFGSTSQAKWLAENCWDYGFILRYTEEKQQITGFLAEPWHFRYVGTEHSRIMHEENLCLEEYLEAYGNITFEDE